MGRGWSAKEVVKHFFGCKQVVFRGKKREEYAFGGILNNYQKFNHF